jgi:hypothetical protein
MSVSVTQPEASFAKKILNNTRLYNSDPSVISPIFFHLVQPTIARNTKWHTLPGRPQHTKGIFSARRNEKKVRALRLLLFLSWKIYLLDQFYERALRLSHLHAMIPADVDRKLKCIPQIYNEHEGVYTRVQRVAGARANNRRWKAT